MLEVGRVIKAHGLRGEVVVQLFASRPERVAKSAQLFAGERELIVKSAKEFLPHPDRWIVTFVGVDDRNAADLLHSQILMGPVLDDNDEYLVHELIGLEIFDTSKQELVGKVVEVEANPAADLLVTEAGALIPMTFVRHVNNGRIEVELPDGLLEALS